MTVSPCIGVCQLDAAGYCVGCHRSGGEIAGWLGFHPDQRQHLMDHVLPARERRHAVRGALVWSDVAEGGLYCATMPGAAKAK